MKRKLTNFKIKLTKRNDLKFLIRERSGYTRSQFYN